MTAEHLAAMRRSYQLAGLSESDLAADPVAQFERWFKDAVTADLPEPNAMILATASETGRPSARTVLLKSYGEEGFVFYTNYASQKARELTANPQATALFPWHGIGRQVIVTGVVAKISSADSAAYFTTRPYDSRIGAWASRQSEVIASRRVLDERYAELAARWPDPDPDQVPVPDFWGGFLIVPDSVEFWQGRMSRLHDRLRYRRLEGMRWLVDRLAP